MANPTDTIPLPPRTLSVAPMMAWTTPECRYFLRLITRHTWLYTEMVTAQALMHGNSEHLLRRHPAEGPVALQLGGCDPRALAKAAALGEAHGYNEINLNVGCPSDRVRNGRFGACLMAEPGLVADCVAAMADACSVPVTVKTRIGIDDMDDYQDLAHFTDTVARAGCRTFIVHARKAWLQGLSPRENREVPPLRYESVYRLKREFPELEIIINGGVREWDAVDTHLLHVDGVMIGRQAYHDPYLLAAADARLYEDGRPCRTRAQVVRDMLPYVREHIGHGERLHTVTRHMLGLFQGQPGARRWRRYLSTHGCRAEADEYTLLSALAEVTGLDDARHVA